MFLYQDFTKILKKCRKIKFIQMYIDSFFSFILSSVIISTFYIHIHNIIAAAKRKKITQVQDMYIYFHTIYVVDQFIYHISLLSHVLEVIYIRMKPSIVIYKSFISEKNLKPYSRE